MTEPTTPSPAGWYFLWHPLRGYARTYLSVGELDEREAAGWTREVPPVTCEWCGWDEDVPNEYYTHLCNSCADDARDCAGCGRTDHYENMPFYERTDEYYCENCYPRRNDDALEDYSYKPAPVFHYAIGGNHLGTFDYWELDPIARTAPFMGFELEMEAEGNYSVNDAVRVIKQEWGEFAYCKHDGSLEYGLELVTHPFTLEYAHKHIDWSLLDRLRRMGFRSWNTETAGMHVHVNRATFTGQAHLYRFAQLVYKNESMCKSFAGRDSAYASFTDGYQKGHLARIVKGQYHSNRGAVNMLNSSTIEVRIFRGSLKPQRVLANLEFVNAAVEYTRTLSVSDCVRGGLSWRAFATWILDHRNTYTNLFSYFDFAPTAPNRSTDPEYASY